MALPEKKGLASMFGKSSAAKTAGGPPSEPDADDMMSEEDDGSVPPDFEDYATTALPELEGDSARLKALYQMVKACK